MYMHRIRNFVPLVYAGLIIGGFAISSTVGVVVCIVGGMLFAATWSALSGSGGAMAAPGRRGDRAAARAARRAGQR